MQEPLADAEPVVKPKRKGNRVPISCTECRRRRQKCNRESPCNHCVKRFPQPACVYDNVKAAANAVARQNKSSTRESSSSAGDPDPGGIRENLTKYARTWTYTSEVRHPSDPARYMENPYRLPRTRFASVYGCPEAFDEDFPMIVQPLPPIPIDNTGRNAELFHFFHYVLAPYIGAIDGIGQGKLISDHYRPWMANSTFMAYTAILSASYFQAEARRVDISKHVEGIVIKAKIISMINDYIRDHQGAVSDEMISSVNHLLVSEWYYGDTKSQIAHMKGLQQMLRLRGGLEGMRDNPSLYALLVITDYQMACTCERELVLHRDTRSGPLKALDSYPLAMECPLLQSSIRFIDIHSTLGISKAAAAILDDMRFLTCSIIALTASPSTQETLKTITTTRWIHDRMAALPSIASPELDTNSPLADDFIYECCRLAALIYSSAILSRTQLSKACSMEQQHLFWANMPLVSLTNWKAVSGIYLWLCLVMCPGAEFTVYGRFLKSMASTTMTFVGLADWDVMVGCMEGFLRVQRWLRGEGGVKRIAGGGKRDSAVFGNDPFLGTRGD